MDRDAHRPHRSALRRLGLSAAAALLVGCAGMPVDPYALPPIADHLERPDAVGDCARLFRQADARVDAAGTRDGQAPRVPGFPYLRADRFGAVLGAPAAPLMAELDRGARAAELVNAGGSSLPAAAALDSCRDTLAAADRGLAQPLTRAVQVPDDYSALRRALGLYPLTRLVFAAGIRGWQHETRALFAQPLPDLPVHGVLVRHAPGAPAAAPIPPPPAGLGLRSPTDAAWTALLQRHAPLLEVDTTGEADRPGALVWRPGRTAPAVDAAVPAAYVRAAYTLIGDRVHLQLVYAFWFSQRPPTWPLDPFAGELDALLWRVTLDADLEPLVYDSIHGCGCYHLFFPTARVRPRPGRPPGQGALDEGLFVPQAAPALQPRERIVLRLASGTHHLQRVYAAGRDTAADGRYTLRDDDGLRHLPWPDGGTRSIYGPDGLVAGSQRLERFLFWPMGIDSAGQMRQWGRHATAFVGRRHFDDARLIDRYFLRVAPTAPDDPARPH